MSEDKGLRVLVVDDHPFPTWPAAATRRSLPDATSASWPSGTTSTSGRGALRVEVRLDSKLVHICLRGRLVKTYVRQARGGRAGSGGG